MKVLVDDRVGSRELARPLRRAGLSVQLTRLDFGDVRFVGNGPSGPVTVGIERKKVDELIGAITDPRFASRQLPGLMSQYDISYLLVEGTYRQGREGELLVGRGREAGYTRQRILYDTFEHWLTSIEIGAFLRAGHPLHVKHVSGFEPSVAWLHAIATWWGKDWKKHTSFRVVDEAEARSIGFEVQSCKRSVAAQLPGVYHTRSAAAARSFSSILAMITAGERRWQRVDGIGPKTARRIVKAIREKT